MSATDTLNRQIRDRDPQEVVAALRSRAEQMRDQLADEDLGARAQHVQQVATERAHELEETVRERLEELEPTAREAQRQVQIGLWRALRALFAGLAALPTLLFRVLRSTAGTLDDVAERTDLEQRARRAAELLPDRRPPRVRRRTALLWVAGGVGVGFAGGYLLARRREHETVVYDASQPEMVDPVTHGVPGADAALRE